MLILAMLRRVHLFCLSFAMSAACLMLAGLLAAEPSENGDVQAAVPVADMRIVENLPVRLVAGAEFQ